MHLDQKALSGLRKQLLTLRGELKQAEETGVQAEQTVELDQSSVGRLTRMDAMQGQAMSKETGRRRRLHLRQIEEALHRLDANEYGNCLECGETINIKRLEFDPATPLCITCAQALE